MPDIQRNEQNSRAQCNKKKYYSSEEQAMQVGKHFKQRAYLCDHCRAWHLTSKKRYIK
jgi:hypothetical protein